MQNYRTDSPTGTSLGDLLKEQISGQRLQRAYRHARRPRLGPPRMRPPVMSSEDPRIAA